MKTQYSTRPFADEFSGGPVRDVLSTIAVRGSEMFVAGLVLTTAFAAAIAH